MRRHALRLALALVLVVGAAVAARAEDGFDAALTAAMRRQDEQVQAGRFDDAVRDAREATRENTPAAWYLLGRALGNSALARRDAGDERGFRDLLDESRSAFGTAKELGGLRYAPAFLGLARCSQAEEDLPSATQELRSALRIAPTFKPAVLELARVLWGQGLHADAELELHRFLEAQPDDLDARMLLGTLKGQRKRWADAEREFRVVVRREPTNVAARKLLGTSLMFQDHLEEAAEQWEYVRHAEPDDDEPYIALFEIYRGLKRPDAVRAVLEALIVALPDSEAAHRARATLASLDAAAEAAEVPDSEADAATLVERLKAAQDDTRRVALLRQMRRLAWPALPPVVYALLTPTKATAEVRAAAVDLIGSQSDARIVSILEILLFHEVERDPAPEVRRAAARALATTPTDATVPMLYRLLDDPDVELREAAVRGLAARTGTWYRASLEEPTPADAWPAERERYAAWWRGASGSLAKRAAMEAMVQAFAHLRRGRPRLAQYALVGLEDGAPRTWNAGFELFRALTGESFGATAPVDDAAERTRVTAEARAWVATHRDEER